MSIDTLEITNFQNHEYLKITFDPELTTIIGPSDVGKSAILRALRWVCLNVPSGVAMLKDGSDGSECALSIDGHIIDRLRKSDGTNTYKLDGQEYKAFGTGVPDAIQKLLCVDSINFVGQKEPDFWFSLSPAEVSRQLNAVVDLGVIDEANENIGKRMWQCQEAVRVTTALLDDLKVKRADAAWVLVADVGLKEIEGLDAQRVQVASKRRVLCDLVDAIKGTTGKRDIAKAYYEAAAVVGRQWVVWQKLSQRVKQLSDLLVGVRHTLSLCRFASVDIALVTVVVGQLQAIAARRVNLSRLVEGFRQSKNMVALGQCHDSMAKISDIKGKVTEIRVKASALRSRMDAIRTTRSVGDAAKQACAFIHGEIETVTDGRCPICGAELQEEAA